MVSDQFYFHEKCLPPELLANLQAIEDGDTYHERRYVKEWKRRLLGRVMQIAEKALTRKQKEAFFLKLMGKNTIGIGVQLDIAQMSAWERLDRAYRRLQVYLEVDEEIISLLAEMKEWREGGKLGK